MYPFFKAPVGLPSCACFIFIAPRARQVLKFIFLCKVEFKFHRRALIPTFQRLGFPNWPQGETF